MSGVLEETSIGVVRRFFDALNAWDFDTLEEIFAADLVFELPFAPPGLAVRIQGGPEFLDFVRRVPDVFDEERLQGFEIHACADDPNEVVDDEEVGGRDGLGADVEVEVDRKQQPALTQPVGPQRRVGQVDNRPGGDDDVGARHRRSRIPVC